jgi:hypothetical protein
LGRSVEKPKNAGVDWKGLFFLDFFFFFSVVLGASE